MKNLNQLDFYNLNIWHRHFYYLDFGKANVSLMLADVPIKQTTQAQSLLLYVASGLVLTMGVILYFLAGKTETFFAWTIDIPLTAAFLGAGYLASFILEFMAARERLWSNSRIAVPAVLTFTSLTFIITLFHLDKFHLDSTNTITLIVTWAWILVYAVVPVIMGVILFQQMRATGADTPKLAKLPRWFKTILGIQGAIMVVLGIAFLLVPMSVAPLWAWTLTPLTGRAIGAWLIGIGTAGIQSIMEDDWRRIRSAMVSYSAYAILQLINLVIYPDAIGLDWALPKTWGYVIFVLSILGIGVYGVWQSRRTSLATATI